MVQLGSILAWGARDRWFKSSLPDLYLHSYLYRVMEESGQPRVIWDHEHAIMASVGSNPAHPTFNFLHNFIYYLYMEEKIYKCKYCGKEFKNPNSVGGHTYACPKNPNYTQNIKRSSDQFIKHNKERRINSNYGTCKYCGTPLNKSGKQFCNSSCAAKFNNKLRSEQGYTTKGKTKMVTCSKCGKEFRASIHISKYICNDCISSTKKSSKKFECICVICGNKFISNYKAATHCSHKCSNQDPVVKEKLRKCQLNLIEQGKHKGWTSRNIHSYPEKFWMKVLTNNHIKFQQELYVKDFGYFLDFVIETSKGMIDLEIDGKQHKYQKEHDTKRDNKLKGLGYIIYRIDWNDINTESGKTLMKNKIDEFIKFYKSMNK